jgi:hypothetical protein
MAVKTLLYKFNMGDVEDPEIYCAGPIWDWQQSEYGQWCMENCIPDSIVYDIVMDYNTYGYKCTIRGTMEDKMYTFHQLRWSNYVDFQRK